MSRPEEALEEVLLRRDRGANGRDPQRGPRDREGARSRPSAGDRGTPDVKQTAEIEKIAGEDRRLGYALEHQPS